MNLDPLLPIAPARVKALVLPIGQIKQPQFASFVERLRSEHVVQLQDITADSRPNRNMFSPLAFPGGAIFYELVTNLPPPSHLALSPFDLYREPLAIIAIADGAELETTVFSRRQSGTANTVAEGNIRTLYQGLEELRDAYPKALVHEVLIFEYNHPKESAIPIPEGLVTIPPAAQYKRTTMKTVMCDLSSMLLGEMTTLARSIEGRHFVDSPGQTSNHSQLNGSSGADGLARRNSQYSLPTISRSSSTGGVGDRGWNRMSMPAMTRGHSVGSNGSTPVRPSSPAARSGLANPPTTFDDIESSSTGPSSPDGGFERPGTSEGARAQSQDRVSVQGFGPGGLNEKWRNKGKGRVAIVLGSLYLQAGRWPDAVKELVEGATVAKSINDHLWHGKALELIMVSLVLLGWAGIEFQIPTVCLSLTDKGTSSSASPQEFEKADHSQPRWLRNLQSVLPDLLDRIIACYSRVTAESLPPLPLSETIIRFCKILAAVHVTDGHLGQKTLDMMVLGVSPDKPLTTSPRLTVSPSRAHIVSVLFRAFPGGPSELLTTVDRIEILSGIASVLGVLGLQRKKAMVIRELISVLTGGFVEARTRGAADVGIHPAAGLAALNGMNGSTNGAGALDLGEGDVEFGVEAFLGMLLRTYGVVGFDNGTPVPADDSSDASVEDSDDAVVARIQQQATTRFFGMQSVKIDLLRACINFSEALPDFAGVLRFSSDLLRTAGKGIAPGPKREDASPIISRDEQMRLVANISKTSGLSQRLGLGQLTAEYWDEFLVRGLKLEPLPASRFPTEHKKSELPGAAMTRASQDVNPFIHNPFLKEPDQKAAEHILVEGEPATFKLTLQNPYDVELDIQSVRLDAEGVDLESSVENTVIGPYRTQVLKITGTPRTFGALQVTGAIIQVRGCRERRFPIFTEPWTPSTETRIKAVGLSSLDKHLEAASSIQQPPKPEHVALTVLPQQPVVVIKSTTIPQSSVMVLEGERQIFSVTLHNLSTTVATDFLLFSFQDSTQEPLQAALNSRDATPAELYEYELILAKKQALRIRKKENNKRFISPGETVSFDFEILGKPGLTNAVVQVDYAYLGVPHEDLEGKFYTRQVSLPLTVTVNASVEIARMDVLPLHGEVPQPLWLKVGHEEADADDESATDGYCLVLLDLRNSWPSNMLVQLDVEGGTMIEEHILPGNTSQVVLPLKRIYLEDPHAAIPVLNPARQRQYVVSTTVSPEMEKANRASFWYREKILDTIKGTWKTTSGPSRSGAMELRSMRLNPRMIDAIKVDEIGIDISVRSPELESEAGRADVAYVDEFCEVNVHITNRTEQPIYPTVRLMPALSHRPLNVALDYTRKLGWNGTLQQFLPVLPGKASADLAIGMTPLCRGEFEITASVEETMVWKPTTESEKQQDEKRRSARQRSNTQIMMDAALGPPERRIWHSRQGHRLIVKDRE